MSRRTNGAIIAGFAHTCGHLTRVVRPRIDLSGPAAAAFVTRTTLPLLQRLRPHNRFHLYGCRHRTLLNFSYYVTTANNDGSNVSP